MAKYLVTLTRVANVFQTATAPLHIDASDPTEAARIAAKLDRDTDAVMEWEDGDDAREWSLAGACVETVA